MVNLDELVETLNEEKVKEEERAAQSSGQADENFLSLNAGHTYLVRLLPNIANKAKTFTSYEEYGFNSINDGKYVRVGRTPKSVGKSDPIKDLQWEEYSKAKASGDEEGMKRSYKLFPQSKQLVNVYIVDNTENPEFNGTVKILRYSSKTGKDGNPISPIFSKIHAAVFGDDKGDIGKRAFDLSASGVSLSIKVKKNSGGWNDYSETSFKYPSDIGLTDVQIKEVYSTTKDLETFIPEVKSESEIKELIAEHWHGRPLGVEESSLSDNSDDEIPMGDSKEKEADLDGDMDDFLDGLELMDSDGK